MSIDTLVREHAEAIIQARASGMNWDVYAWLHEQARLQNHGLPVAVNLNHVKAVLEAINAATVTVSWPEPPQLAEGEKLLPFDPPVETNLPCPNCGALLVALGEIQTTGGLLVPGLRRYQWSHEHGSPVCRMRPRYAQPSDGWHATRYVERTLAARHREVPDRA